MAVAPPQMDELVRKNGFARGLTLEESAISRAKDYRQLVERTSRIENGLGVAMIAEIEEVESIWREQFPNENFDRSMGKILGAIQTVAASFEGPIAVAGGAKPFPTGRYGSQPFQISSRTAIYPKSTVAPKGTFSNQMAANLTEELAAVARAVCKLMRQATQGWSWFGRFRQN